MKNTFVISTHMIDEIESFIDEAIFIKDGEVVRRMSVEKNGCKVEIRGRYLSGDHVGRTKAE